VVEENAWSKREEKIQGGRGDLKRGLEEGT